MCIRDRGAVTPGTPSQPAPDPTTERPSLASTEGLFTFPDQADSTPPARINGLAGFGASAVSSVGELFGKDPSEYVQRFRAQNPTGGLVSQFAGTAVPYIGWEFAAAKVIGKGAAGGLAVGRNVQKPFRQLADEYAKGVAKNSHVGAGAVRELSLIHI